MLVSDLAYSFLKACKCVYNCLVQPIFGYTDTVWGGLSIGDAETNIHTLLLPPQRGFSGTIYYYSKALPYL